MYLISNWENHGWIDKLLKTAVIAAGANKFLPICTHEVVDVCHFLLETTPPCSQCKQCFMFTSRGADVPLQGAGALDGGRRHHRQGRRDHRAAAEGHRRQGQDVKVA